MELVNERLRKELEEELKLGTEQLCSHAWYHGCLPRKEAESMLRNDGEFLIRDSRSSLGDYVLSCQWGGQALHFKIIRVVLRPRKGYSRTLFQFEQEQFDNVPALVRFYVGNRKIISDISGAVVSRPVNRSVPLRCLEECFSDTGQPPGPPKEEEAPLRRFSFCSTIAGEQIGDGNLLRTKDRSGSDPSSLDQLGQRPSLHGAQSDSNLLTGSAETSPGDQDRTQPPPLSPAFRTGSDPVLRPSASAPHLLEGLGLSGSEGRLHSKAPPKPLRIPSMLMSDYCELIPKVPQGPRSHVERLRTEERWRGRAHITETAFGFLDSVQVPFPPSQSEEMEVEPGFERPLLETTSSFQLQHFNSLLLTSNNKPLDSGTLKHLKDIFATHDCHTTALHILKMDCQALRIIGVSKEQQRAMGVSSGLELITLPQGHQFRKDMLERHHLIALGIAVDILGCTGSVAERAATLHKVIQLAVELWRPVGDLFALSAVMKALQLPQISRLEQTWRHLRQSHTASAIVFEKELKPLLGNLNRAEGNSVFSPKEVAIPHILPLLSLMEGEQLWDDNEETCDVLLRTLEAARFVATNSGAYRIRAEARLQGFQGTPELLEVFQTEFSLRLFWGSKGAQVERGERYKKFERILTVLSQKLE
ncbi:breast cancer anti-estrogen resistance protein 3 homolog [Crotalus tigris]|uniref:breast cancer anti-estrogen resistance protein 3 homolog n=1 Tax=Crotalus tigris TaxID=88082 RepID=UPI00192F88B7|nr:breast cancer anti-estrogen resistance protein 3 homolog [Crotalus tigris]XP_039193195.1 breast cancer anti-estrogen resistance protein 3 homolog [Crotalus tigris]XP_039193196.1 breast cancer anti-estrogen resistance protein 3 homolog [Crotalus tigris]XP_039193197.1 breast cancer anti-estrogen resistance protein 3 homolog [Crotalus tigris]